MKNIAFIGTEYQQNILFSICLQKSIEIEILFLREGIPLHKNAGIYVQKVVYFENIPFSWRSIKRYYQAYQKIIAPELSEKENYRVFIWSLHNPLSRYTINFYNIASIYWIDEGSASYASVWPYNYKSGLKSFLASACVYIGTSIFSFSLKPLSNSLIESWTLFSNAYPDYDFQKNIIDHHCYQQITRDSLESKIEKLDIDSREVVFITSAYVEYGILSEDEFVQIMIDALGKLKEFKNVDLNHIYWKLHPRTNIESEEIRLGKISEATKAYFEILPYDSTIEAIVFANQEKNLQYYSLGSSSLYVIKALAHNETTVCLIENEVLKKKVATQSQLNIFYRTIGIETV